MKMKFGFFPYTDLDYKAAQDYLDRKAAQGWVLDSILPFCVAIFVPAEGRQHCVDLRSYISAGSGPDYIQLCRDAGWEYITDRSSMAFFRSLPGADPQPIQSDPNFEWREFLRKQVRQRLIYKGVILLFLLLEPLLFFSSWSQYTLSLLRAVLSYLPFLLCAALLLPVWLWEIGHALRYLSHCRAVNAMAPQRWFPSYLRSTLSILLTLAFLIFWCVVTFRAAVFR